MASSTHTVFTRFLTMSNKNRSKAENFPPCDSASVQLVIPIPKFACRQEAAVNDSHFPQKFPYASYSIDYILREHLSQKNILREQNLEYFSREQINTGASNTMPTAEPNYPILTVQKAKIAVFHKETRQMHLKQAVCREPSLFFFISNCHYIAPVDLNLM